ncbi:MAG: hypothetical protein HYX47_10125 [Burkholderiales bacterium]|nr:hypothetical protein [Burkholderiales bacterium]
MKSVRMRLSPAAFIAASLLCANAWATSPAADDFAAARKATCPELVDAWRTTSAAERKVAAALKDSKGNTVKTNVLGVATLAVLGIGFFTWDDNADAEENLADLRNDLNIITTVAAEKKCELPK